MGTNYTKVILTLFIFFIISNTITATKLDTVKVVDKDYIMLNFKDGIVDFVDDGLGVNAFHGHHSEAENSFAVYYGSPLSLSDVADVSNWVIKSDDDSNFGSAGVFPEIVYRKSRVNGMSQKQWGSDDWIFDYTNEHFIYLKLPNSLKENKTYTIEINDKIKSDKTTHSLTFDIFNNPSEAIHTNLVGYMSSSRVKSADLYHFLGDGGNRDYSDFLGNDVYIYNVDTKQSELIGSVSFWMKNKTEKNHNLTGSDVWNVDFTGFNQTGTFRVAVEGIGCSEDFEIKDDIYHDPYKLSVMGYFYMRIGQDNLDMTPVPRRPLYIQDQDPSSFKVYVTEMHPYHSNWNSLAGGDKWDQPAAWAAYKLAGSPTNPRAIGGHSDALDWDRHLGHVVNIYDLCLAYLITDGALDDDDLRIAESGNGIPDILDEARNEVDFWLNLRYNKGYSHGITNPDGNKMYQAGNTAMAAWANALNSSILAYCFQISGHTDLKAEYQDSAIIAYNYASNLSDQMLTTKMEGVRGVDYKMMAASYLYNLTGETVYEDVINNDCVVTTPTSSFYQQDTYNQIWGLAAYLLSKRTINYPDLHNNIKEAIVAKAKSKESDNVNKRPSRRGYSSENAWWQSSQDMPRTILAHALTDNASEKVTFLDALLLEADWGLGRNPLNMIQMTTATTELENKRSIENCYTSGRDDGSPGLHPGHTPYLNTEGWGGSMAGGNPEKVLVKFYPDYKQWPHASKYINTRHMWAHSEFTPRQTMRGKTLLYSYLYALSKTGGAATDVLIADAGQDQRIVDEDDSGKEKVNLSGSKSFTSNGNIVSYKWTLNGEVISTEKNPVIELEIGNYEIILEVEDANGEKATDTVKINILANTVNQDADYGFENPGQMDDWNVDNWGEGGVPSLSITSAKATNGFNSLKLSGNFITGADLVFKRAGAMTENIESIIYYVWIPQELVDSSKAAAAVDSALAGGIQNYLMHTGWDWRSKWVDLYDLQGDEWNKISFTIPDDVINSTIVETGLTFNIENAGVGESSVYIDDIIYKIAAAPADYDFETAAQFDDWSVEDFSGTGGNPSASQSDAIAKSGSFSYKIEGNFNAATENALRRNGSLDNNVNSLTYNIWVPQELVDSAIAVNNRDTTQNGIIQNYLMHTGWQWISETFAFKDLKGNDWNEVTLNIPESVQGSSVQSFGVTFKTNGVNVGEMSVYIDDIYLGKSEDPTSVNNIARLPNDYKLYYNYPNPFNPSCKIKYDIPKVSKVKICVYDILGNLVDTLVDETKNAGGYEITFNAKNLASGVYIYSIRAGAFSSSQKMLLLK
ncbi:MAG: T9SS type A sorting domain-containing protein [Melioribacteraceae bacterium]|nr:T9SS type A sorting domain-containing protein [Melioribacteraceae bacterium]